MNYANSLPSIYIPIPYIYGPPPNLYSDQINEWYHNYLLMKGRWRNLGLQGGENGIEVVRLERKED